MGKISFSLRYSVAKSPALKSGIHFENVNGSRLDLPWQCRVIQIRMSRIYRKQKMVMLCTDEKPYARKIILLCSLRRRLYPTPLRAVGAEEKINEK